MNSSFSETLRKLREERGLSQKQLGKQMFVNQSTIAPNDGGGTVVTVTVPNGIVE